MGALIKKSMRMATYGLAVIVGFALVAFGFQTRGNTESISKDAKDIFAETVFAGHTDSFFSGDDGFSGDDDGDDDGVSGATLLETPDSTRVQ